MKGSEISQMDIEVEEYRSLRSGIDMHLKHITQFLTFMVAATSVLLGYGFSSKEAWVFLTPLPIILSSVYLIRTQMEDVLKKGAYIMIKFEQNYIGWESTLYKLRQNQEKGKKCLWQRSSSDSRAIFIIAISLIIICLTCFSYFLFKDSIYTFVIFGIISSFFFILFSYCIVLRRVLDAYTFGKEKSYVKKLKKAINDVKET
jgi:hypothetical protein